MVRITRINKTIVTLILSDIFLHSGWGLIGPIFAIFIIEQIKGGGLEMIGFIAATFWITRSIVQPFLANYLDIRRGNKDDFYILIAGMFVANLVPLGYFFATKLSHLFLLEFIRGIAMACVVPSWMAFFTRNINKDWMAFSWSVHSTSIGIVIAFAAAFGGVIASFVGFKAVFILTTIFGMLATSTLLYAKKNFLS